MRAVKIIFNLLLGVIGLVALLILAGHFGYLNTVKPFIVQSGSMAPTIPTGSVVLVRPASLYSQNDVISFHQEGNKKLVVTHRILFKQYPDGATGEPTYITIGDANNDVDRYIVKPSDIIGKSYFTIPYLGYAVNQAKTPKGFILFVIIPATIIVYEEFRSITRELSKLFGKKKDPWVVDLGPAIIPVRAKPQERGMPKAAVVLPIVGCLLVFISLTAAYFLDNEQSSGNIMSAAVSFATPLPTSVQATPTPSPTPEATQSAVPIDQGGQ